MNAKQMIRIIRKHSGPVEVPVMAGDDVWHVVAVKADLIGHLERAGRNPFYVLTVVDEVINGRRVSLMTLDIK